MAEEFADHFKAEATREAEAGGAVAKVVEADIGERGKRPDLQPELWRALECACANRVGENPLVAATR